MNILLTGYINLQEFNLATVVNNVVNTCSVLRQTSACKNLAVEPFIVYLYVRSCFDYIKWSNLILWKRHWAKMS